jgi:16S rRNA (guanine1207-N2)-methyltransferase
VAEHYFSGDPAAPSRPRTVRFDLDGRSWELAADAGVFSGARLDPGTAVLLRHADAPADGGTLLDLGCGYGPIACVLARRAPRATVWAVDVNERALALTRANAATLDLPVRVARPEDVPAALPFDQIWSNPPVRIGKAALHDLLLQWLPRLSTGGRGWLVVGRNLGADSLAAWLREQGFPVTRHASQKGYRVLRVDARSPLPTT